MLKKLDNFAIFFLLLFSGISFLLGLGNTYLTNWDEAWYAGISRNMLERSDFITPYWNGLPYFDKGPLYHWLSVLAFQVFPRWELAARLPSALAGIGCVLLVYLLGKNLFSRKVGFISSLILASTIGFLFRSRTGNLDALMVFLILTSFLFFFLAQKNPRYFFALGVSLGFLVLTKTAFILYPLLVLALLVLYERKLKTFKNYFFLLGLIITFTIPGLWFLLGAKAAGKPFIDFYLNLLFWPIDKVGGSGHQTFQFSFNYFSYLFYGSKVWFFFFLPAFLFSFFKIWKNRAHFFLLISFFPYFLVLLFTKEAGDWYLLPLYPIVAIMTGVFLVWFQEKVYPQKFATFILEGLILFLAISQNFYFRSLFITSETLKNEVDLSRSAKEFTLPGEIIIIDDYYFPVASFYSERKIKVVRRKASDTALALSKESFYRMIQAEKKLVILTTAENFTQISRDLKSINFKVEKQAEGHLLVSKK